jgi:hypothetical protein
MRQGSVEVFHFEFQQSVKQFMEYSEKFIYGNTSIGFTVQQYVWKLKTPNNHLQQVPRSTKRGSINSLPLTPSSRSA